MIQTSQPFFSLWRSFIFLLDAGFYLDQIALSQTHSAFSDTVFLKRNSLYCEASCNWYLWQQVSHEFPINFNPANPFCAGTFKAVLSLHVIVKAWFFWDSLAQPCSHGRVCRRHPGSGGGLPALSASAQTLGPHQLFSNHQPCGLLRQTSTLAECGLSKQQDYFMFWYL